MECKSCGSDKVQRVQMAYEMGTQNISTTSKGRIVGTNHTISSSGGGTQQTELARRLAPPRKRSLNFAAVVMLVGLFMSLTGMNLGKESSHSPATSVAQTPHKQKKTVEKTEPASEATAPAAGADLSPVIASFTHPLFLTGFAFLLIGVAWSLRNRLWNRRQWPLLFAEWQRRWVCHQCGTVFAPKALMPTSRRKRCSARRPSSRVITSGAAHCQRRLVGEDAHF